MFKILYVPDTVLRRSNGQREAKLFSVSGRVTSSFLTPTVLSSRVNMRNGDEITSGGANEG